MWLRSWLGAFRNRKGPRRLSNSRLRAQRRLRREGLEDRRLLTFAPAVDYFVGANPQAIVAADFNNDAILDLATANYWDSTVSVLLGNADGTFQPALTSATGATPRSLAVGDLDDDGILDLAVAGGYSSYWYGYGDGGEVSVLLGNDNGAGKGDGTFQDPVILSVVDTPTSVAVGDFDGDGLLDIGATMVYYYYWYGYLSSAKVLLGDGSGGFTGPNTTWIGYGYLTSATAEDLDGDGADDLIAANPYGYGYYSGDVAVFAGSGSGYLQFPEFFYTGADAVSVAVEDVNGDAVFDIVTANGYYNSVSVLLGDQLGGFAAQTYLAGHNATSVVVGDFNQDAALDIATANSSGSDVSVLYGDGSGAFAPPINTSTNGAYALAAGDFNGDTWLDVATVNPNGNSISVLLNDQTWPPAPDSLSIDDVTAIEGDSGTVAAVFTVTRSGDLAGEVTVNYSTSNGGALAGSDYVADSGTLTFPDGVDTMTVTILVNGDVIDEYDQGFYVTLSAPSGAIVVDGSGFGQILDDDDAPTISIVSSVSGKEGGNRKTTSLVFVVTLSAPSEKDVWVNFTTADGTATVADGDYVASAGSLYFAPGTTSQTISILVKGDKKKEEDETFSVLLSGATNATIASGTGVGVILNDDSPRGKGKP